jgi:4-hydroxybenzoate polyprenyltransferase
MTDTRVFDAPKGNWVDRFAPPRTRPYARLARLDRPIGWWLLLWPCWWSAALAAGAAGMALPNPWHLALFMVGAIVMRGAGCTYNDILDRRIDASVERTRSRPIPSGQVTKQGAKLWMVALALTGFVVLIQFNVPTILLGVCSLAVVAVYPLAKRVTHWPQIVLGLAFSWGALLGWTAIFGELGWPAIALYAAAVVWTLGYDTIYAHQDKEDDAVVGVKSTALLFGPRTRPVLAVVYAVTAGLLATALALAGAGPLAFAGLALFAAQLVWQVATVDIDDGANCLHRFRSNGAAGWILFAGLVADAAVRNGLAPLLG